MRKSDRQLFFFLEGGLQRLHPDSAIYVCLFIGFSLRLLQREGLFLSVCLSLSISLHHVACCVCLCLIG